MRHFARTLAAAGVVAVSLSCADQSTGLRASGLASLPISPVFIAAAEGGPRIPIGAIHAVLKRPGTADSNVAIADVRGDSAVLEFPRVIVRGDSSTYELHVRAFDTSETLIFKAIEDISVVPGDNSPKMPVLHYVGPDADADTIEVRSSNVTISNVNLDWAGGRPGDISCLNRLPTSTSTTQVQLAAVGSADGSALPDVRVGWRSRDTSVATVDENGLVRARCSNKSTYVVARTFLGVADSVLVNVTAPPFTLLMTPETGNVPRQDSLQLRAVVVDEHGNAITTTGVTWSTSDSARATVSASGMVRGIDNGRVLITASSGNRTTVGVIQVVPPRAASVSIDPPVDTLAVGESRVFSAAAFDAGGTRIPDAAGFTWGTENAGIARVSSSGIVTGVGAGIVRVVVAIDERKDTALVHVRVATDGQATGAVRDGATGAALPGVSVSGPGSPAMTDASGRFVTSALTPPAALQFSATGHVTVVYHAIPLQLGQVVDLGDIPMAPVNPAPGTMTGTVVNALNDSPVPNATVRIYPGINPPSANPSSGETTPAALAETTTDVAGAFTLAGVPAGTYTYSVTSAGFSHTRRVAVSIGGAIRATRIPLSPALADGTIGLRIVLSWGDCVGGASNTVPCDLDAHLTGPATAPDQGRFHVAYFNEYSLAGLDTVGVLDNDATDGLGPETVTLRPRAAGVYKFYVHNYTDGSDTTSLRLTTAQARVDVYKGTNLIATFIPPRNQPGTVWAVFQLDGTTLTPVSEVLRIQDFSEVPGDFLRVADPVRDELRAVARRRTKP